MIIVKIYEFTLLTGFQQERSLVAIPHFFVPFRPDLSNIIADLPKLSNLRIFLLTPI